MAADRCSDAGDAIAISVSVGHGVEVGLDSLFVVSDVGGRNFGGEVVGVEVGKLSEGEWGSAREGVVANVHPNEGSDIFKPWWH